MYQRYVVILYHLKGYTNKDISQLLDLCQHTVGVYIKKYNTHGLNGLEMGYSTGAPRMLNDEQEAKLIEIITTKTPDEVGFPNRKNWNIAIIRQWIGHNSR